ncbi:MAG TPA: RNA polymerase sigma factor [Candidatus Acidoferrum sp.]|nr:RNA polymerase sigma factor [Candidatus Acidoferrum sp.]
MPTSCKPVSHDSHNLVEAGPEVMGMEAFQEMFVAYRPKFVAMANAILRNREDAEDAVQNAFVSGYFHLRSFEGRSALTTWFTRIVLNAALMIRRKRKSPWISPQPETSTSDDGRWMQRILASQPDPEMVYAERETLEFINAVLGKMKPALRQALTMIYYDELSGPEACALLGVSAGTFKARLFRARRQLLNQVQRALVAPIRTETRSSFSSDRSAYQHLVARPSNTSSLEASNS